MRVCLRLALAAGLSVLAVMPGSAQNLTAPVRTEAGAKADATGRSTADPSRSDRAVEAQRRRGELQLRRRDDAMRKSMKSICSGC